MSDINRNRTKNSVLNILSSSFGSMVGLVVSFFSRVVFLHFLNATYLGVSGLFSNILLIFSLVELGIGSALTQMFYKPFAEKDYKHLSQVTHTTKILLNLVGVVIIILTCIFVPCLQFFVGDINAVPHMRLIFFMYGISSSVTYFLGYYRTIITANQQAYKLIRIDNGWKILAFILKSVILAFTRNFVFYLAMEITLNFLLNVVICFYVRRQIPQINYKTREFVSREEGINLFKNVVGLSLNKVANVVTNGTDNIIISKFLDLATVGIASNYTLIQQSVNSLVESIFSPLLASIGNLCVSENIDVKYRHYNNLTFAAFWFYGFCSIVAFVLSDRFVAFVFGNEYLIPKMAAFFIFFDLFCVGTYRVSTLFRTAEGIFWHGKFRPLLQALVNLIVSLVLVSLTNELWAVYAGTVASRVLITMWYEPLIVLKYAMNEKPWKYYSRLLSYIIVYFIALIITKTLVGFVPMNGLIGLIFCACICISVPNLIMLLVYFRTSEFEYWLSFIKGLKKKLSSDEK